MYRKSYCTTLGDRVGVGGGRAGVDKMLKFHAKVF